MPYINITMTKSLDSAARNCLQQKIGDNMPLIPGKTIANTVISFNEGCAMFKNGQPFEAVFVDIRLYKNSPEENKKEFAEKLFSIFQEVLEIPPSNVQMNFLEQTNWASGGSYR